MGRRRRAARSWEFWDATDLHLERDVVLARPREPEAEALIGTVAGLGDAALPRVLDAGGTGRDRFLVLERPPSATLAEALRAHRPSPAAARELARSIVQALVAARARGLVPEVLGPAHVGLAEHGPVLVDVPWVAADQAGAEARAAAQAQAVLAALVPSASQPTARRIAALPVLVEAQVTAPGSPPGETTRPFPSTGRPAAAPVVVPPRRQHALGRVPRIVWLLLLVGAIAGIVIAQRRHTGSSVASGATAVHCPAGVKPAFTGELAALQKQIGAPMGSPTDCPYTNNANGDTLQNTSTGLAYIRKSSGAATFTNGVDHWALAGSRVLHWQGSEVDPPADATSQPAG